jgi:uncharacterized protein (TIGR02001 family)
MFRKTILAGLTAAVLATGHAQAQQQPASAHTITGNIGLYSQYIFRGLTQTNGDPALQGGFDYSHSSGFYLGTWASNISWLRDGTTAAGSGAPAYSSGGSLEWDFYGGYKWGLASDFTLDVGTLYYWYPGDANTSVASGGNPLNPKADTWEVYAGLSWKWLSGKFSYSVDNETFGVLDSRGTYYLDLTAAYPLADTKLTVIAHYGIQKFTGQDPRLVGIGDNDTIYSYEDWKIGVSYALPKDFTIGVFYTDTSGADVRGYGTPFECVGAACGVYPKNISGGTATVFISKTF